jgi:ubiquinone biosynthesis protein
VVGLISTVRDMERLRQIVLVLVRHGFGEVVDRAGLGRFLRKTSLPPDAVDDPSRPEPRAEVERITVGERLRLVLQDLGPSFVKLGQILSTRPDILPPDVINQLKLLQDRVPPVPFGELRAELEAELGAPLSEVFAHFDETPLASASVAQVHRARLVVEDHTDEVVLKIQRPNIRDTVERDIELLYLLARAIERSIPEARIYSPVGLVTEFDRAISDELDFTREADHAERFSRAFAGDPHVKFPRVYRELTRKKVLVMELLAGLHVSDALAAGYSGERMAKRLLHALFKQIYEDGFFHGDPHPGNIMILGTPEEPVIGFLDLGLVGRMSPEMRDHTVDLMVAAARQDVRGIADALYAIGTPTKRIDRQRYEAEVAVLAEKYLGKPLKDIALSALIRDIVGGAVKYGLEIPPEFLMLGRTLMTVEGVGKQLYPELDVYSEALPFFMRLLRQRYSPERLGADALRVMSKLGGTASGLPAKIDDILSDLRGGALSIRAHDPSLAGAADLLGRRIFSGLAVAGLTMGGALLLSRGAAPLPAYLMLGAAAVWLTGHVVRAALAARRLMRREREDAR